MIEVYNSIYSLIIGMFPLEVVTQFENLFVLVSVFAVVSIICATIILPITKLFKWVFGGF